MNSLELSALRVGDSVQSVKAKRRVSGQVKRVKQSTSTNCFAACVATLLEIPIEEVPKACDGLTWDWQEFQRWLADNFDAQCIEFLLDYDEGRLFPIFDRVYCILTGKSPRPCPSGMHAVVGEFRGADLMYVHDPHESNAFLLGDPTHVCFFVPISPHFLLNRKACAGASIR